MGVGMSSLPVCWLPLPEEVTFQPMSRTRLQEAYVAETHPSTMALLMQGCGVVWRRSGW